MQNVKCEGCAFWFQMPFETANGETKGQFRKNPPTIQRTDKGVRAMWPLTECHDWCGEHAVEQGNSA